MDITKLNKLAILFFIIGRFYVNLLLAEEIDYEDFTTTLKNLEEITVKTPNQRFKFNKNRIPSPISKRIIGGAVAGKHEYPFQAVLYIYVGTNLFFCGGTLITTQWVLTAAHCCDGASSIIVVLGAHNINLEESTTKAFNTSLYRIHENWDSERITYDIALIHLGGTPVILNEYIQTVEIASSDDYDDDDGGYNNNNSYTDQTGRCLGWGKTVFGSLSSVLRYVDSSIISNDACSTYPDYRYYIRSQHLCTSGENKVGSCNGDSGGPLIVDGLQVGIVSFGAEDCSTGYPSVFTRITEFSSWVKNTTRTFELITYEDEIISLGLGIRRYSSIFNLLTLIIFNTVKNLLLN